VAYIAQKTRIASITINGTDYTDEFVSFAVSDESAWQNGLIATTGQIILAQKPTAVGVTEISDYNRDQFKRNSIVILKLREPESGSEFVHPRGNLRVITTSYDIEQEQLIIEVGCKIAMALLAEDRRQIVNLLPIELEATRNTINNYSAAFWGAGKYLYQDNNGDLVVGEFWEGDSLSGFRAGEWASVLGETALAVAPLETSEPVPEKIDVTYDLVPDPTESDPNFSVETDAGDLGSQPDFGLDYDFQDPTLAGQEPGDYVDPQDPDDPNPGSSDPVPNLVPGADNTGYVDRVSEYSNYFTAFPATVAKRNPPPEDPGSNEPAVPTVAVQPPSEPVGTSGCGNTPSPPETPSNPDGDQGVNPLDTKPAVLCSDNWTTNRETVYLPAQSLATTVTYYNGPAAQASMVKRNLLGPPVEVNPQYFADQYAYCTLVWGTACNVNGNCPYYGTGEMVKQSYSYAEYYYNPQDNSLALVVEDVYQTRLSAAIPSDWRSGVVNGKPQDFTEIPFDDFYRAQRTMTSYKNSEGLNIQTTVTYTSIASRGVGINSGQSLDALDGIRTSTRRISTDAGALDVTPDALNDPSFETETLELEVLLPLSDGLSEEAKEDDAYGDGDKTEGGSEAVDDPSQDRDVITMEIRLPVPLKGSEAERQATLDAFVNYVGRFVKGQAYGLRVAEPLRTEIATTWYPGVPFRYYDSQNDELIALRADAASWGVTKEESVMVCDGMFQGFSSGSVSVGDNLTGDSRPDMGGGTTPPTAPSGPPTVTNDNVGQSFAFRVRVDLYLNTSATVYFPNGVSLINPTDLTGQVEQSLVTYCTGFVVSTGGLLEAEGNGSIPVDYNGSLITSGATIIESDLFATAP